MGFTEISDEYMAFARQHISRRVNRLARAVRFSDMDRDDFEQEILLFVYQSLPKYDPTRGTIEAFTNKAVTSRIRNFLDPRSARMAESRRVPCSLDDHVVSGDGDRVSRGELLDAQIAISNRSDLETYTPEQIDLKLDIDRVVESLPPPLAELCDALKRGNISEASEELHLNRREVTRRICRLRGLFEQYWSDGDAKKVAHFFDSFCKE